MSLHSTDHRGLAHAIANDYWIPGADRDDVHQEALIGLWVAEKDWDENKGPFYPFARLVIHRHLQTKVRDARRGSQMALTLACREMEAVAVPEDDSRELLARIIAALPLLTQRERRALADVLNEIPQDTATSSAVQKARRKLRAA